jgi:hypothetical protein
MNRKSTWIPTLALVVLATTAPIKAEALARQNDLAGAVDAYNQLRARAGLAEHTLGGEVTTQDDVLGAIDLERQFELGFEGDRWPDLVRSGRGGGHGDPGVPDPLSGSPDRAGRGTGHHPESRVLRKVPWASLNGSRGAPQIA